MRIRAYQPIKYTSINFQAKKHYNLRQLAKDVFQKTTTKTQTLENDSFVLSKKEINEIYNEAFDFILKHNPIMQEFKVQKPKITYGSIKMQC